MPKPVSAAPIHPCPPNFTEPLPRARYIASNTRRYAAGWEPIHETQSRSFDKPVGQYDVQSRLDVIPGYSQLNDKFKELQTQVHSTSTSSSPSIIFLGTSSASPSRYRNVTGFVVKVSTGYIAFDLGESSMGQILRAFGAEETDEVLRQTRLVFLSHIHADHHAGTASFFIARARAFQKIAQPPTPLLLIAPTHYKRFLKGLSILHKQPLDHSALL